MSYVRCAECGTVYDTVGTTTGMSGCCPKCGLHHSGQYRVVKPILKPSPLVAQPMGVPERTCRRFWTGAEMICSECAYQLNNATANYCPNCGARVVDE